MKKYVFLLLFIMSSVGAMAQIVPAANDTTLFTITNPFTPSFRYVTNQYGRLTYVYNPVTLKYDLVITSKYLRNNFGPSSDVTFKSLSYTLMTHLATPASYFLTLDGGGKTVERTTDDVRSDIGATLQNITTLGDTTNKPMWSDTLYVKYHGPGTQNSPLTIYNAGGIGGTVNTLPVSLFKVAYAGGLSENAVYNRAGNYYTAFDPTYILDYLETGQEGISLHVLPINPSGTQSNGTDDRILLQARAAGVRGSNSENTGTRIQHMTGVYAERSTQPLWWSSGAMAGVPFGEYRSDVSVAGPSWSYNATTADATTQNIAYIKARGNYTAPTAALLGDTIYNLRARVNVSAGTVHDAARISIIADGNANSVSSPGAIDMAVTPSGSTTLISSFHINNNSTIVLGAYGQGLLHASSLGLLSSSLVSLTADVTGLLPDANISSAANWNNAYTNRITSLTTTGNSGASTLIANTLNIPTYTLTGLGGAPITSPTFLVGVTLPATTITSNLTYTNVNTGFFFKNSGNNRWIMDYEDSESGGDSGSNFYIYRYHDGGSFAGTALNINRATGLVSIGGAISIGNTVTASTTNTVTNKIAIVIGGTTYYILASTSSL